MDVVVLPTPADIARAAADRIADIVSQRPDTVLGLATGSSPLPLYQELARRHREEGLSLAQTQAFLLDEYVGLPADHPEAYRNVIDREFISLVDIPREAVNSPSGTAEDMTAACAAYEEAMRAAGGVDIQILGIGTDGHIAFNEPASALTSRTRLTTLTKQTRADNARFFNSLEEVPMHAVTQGLGTIMEAREILLIATGTSKAEAVAQLVEGPISALWPATVLQNHQHTTVFVDEEAGANLQLRDYYAHVHHNRPGA
ncbi:MAG TPA: glucosamine-6-phosphate deaminase [Actinomycetales bacterium]|nr:glucosamine-6-phosphate deaminase [Actinomycetales bacterium]